MATIKCLTRCHFAILTRADYQKSLLEIDKRRLNEKINFVKSLPLFESLSRTYMTKFTYNLKKVEINKDGYIYKEG